MAKKIPAATAWATIGLLIFAGIAWACTAQPQIWGITMMGGSGTTIVVEGSAFPVDSRRLGESGSTPLGSPVEIRWNSLSGPLLATAIPEGPSGKFSTSIVLPEGSPGVHYVLAGTGGVAVARTPIELTRGPGSRSSKATAANDLWEGFERQIRGQDAPGLTATKLQRPGIQVAGLTLLGLGGLASLGMATFWLLKAAKRSRKSVGSAP